MITDPIADYLTSIRNALKAKKKQVEIPASNFKIKMTEILRDHSLIHDFSVVENKNKSRKLQIKLKYYEEEGVIMGLERVSKPGIRRYVSSDELPRVLNGLGMAIVSTSRGLMTDKEARKLGIGGEVICYIW